MKPNLTLSNIAGVLAALGTSAVIAACGGNAPDASSPVNANEVNSSATPAGAQASYSTNHTPRSA